jgi:hypothetical protein
MYIPAIGYFPVRTPWSAAGTTAQASEHVLVLTLFALT